MKPARKIACAQSHEGRPSLTEGPAQATPPKAKPNPAVRVVQEIELADKTVRAKDNNEKLHAALQAKARQAGRMTVMNQGLAFENRSLRNDVDLAKASEVHVYIGGNREEKWRWRG